MVIRGHAAYLFGVADVVDACEQAGHADHEGEVPDG